jgi:hypothetical protein
LLQIPDSGGVGDRLDDEMVDRLAKVGSAERAHSPRLSTVVPIRLGNELSLVARQFRHWMGRTSAVAAGSSRYKTRPLKRLRGPAA